MSDDKENKAAIDLAKHYDDADERLADRMTRAIEENLPNGSGKKPEKEKAQE